MKAMEVIESRLRVKHECAVLLAVKGEKANDVHEKLKNCWLLFRLELLY